MSIGILLLAPSSGRDPIYPIRLLLAGGYRLRTYRLLMSTQKQLFRTKKEPLISQRPLSTNILI